MTFDPYHRTTSSVGDYYTGISSSSEINMRQELINMFDGVYPEIPKASIGLLRKMRRDTNGLLLSCPCVDLITKEPDKDRYCPICLGEGYYWDETEIQYYCIVVGRDVSNVGRERLTAPGLINVPLVVFYIRYDVPVTTQDKIIRVSLDLEGEPVVPRRRDSIYRITKTWDYRLDNGKLEYWKVYTFEEHSKYLNGYGG